MEREYDYIVVGAGSAGCVLAARLSESHRVLLVESGGRNHRALRIRAPLLYNLLWRSKYDWERYTEPQAAVDQRKMYWPLGKVLGGTSCLNAMVYIRGHRDNYDGWRDAGCEGWGWDDVLPYFRKSEGYRGPASDYHGTDGPLTVTPRDQLQPVSEAFLETAAAHYGVETTTDFNTGNNEGFGRFDHTIRDGERCSTARAFLVPALGSANLDVVTGATVTRIDLDGTAARGIRYAVGTAEHTARARREVVVSAGAVGSPQLLLLSGIGPADHLRSVGVDVVADLPGVGENLQDHLLTFVTYKTLRNGSRKLSMPRLLAWVARFATTRNGPLRDPPVECGGFVKTASDQPRPNLQYHFLPFGAESPNTDEKRDPWVGREFSLLPSLIYPKSRGSLRLRSADPTDAPAIDPRYFSDDADMQLLVDGVKVSRELAHTAPLSEFRGEEICPGAGATTDDQIRANIRNRLNTIFHPVGTCKMGVDDLAVVDPQLRVRGIDNLRVVDGSVMPNIIGGNTNAPITMIAEKAAELMTSSTP